MILSFKDRATEDIFNGENTAAARRSIPVSLSPVAGQKLSVLHKSSSLDELRSPPGNCLEALSGD